MSRLRQIIPPFCLSVALLFPAVFGSELRGVKEGVFEVLEREDPDLAARIGVAKLSPAERAALEELLLRVYQVGYQSGIQDSRQPSSEATPKRDESCVAFKTTVSDCSADIIKLTNGGIVEIASGYVGYIGYYKTAVLYNVGTGWKIWVEGKRSYRCDLLKEPHGRGVSVEEAYISEVRGNGSLLVMSDGAMYEVDSFDTMITCLWLGMSNALILNGVEIINLDHGSEAVTAFRIK